jgi:hypothetical protein
MMESPRRFASSTCSVGTQVHRPKHWIAAADAAWNDVQIREQSRVSLALERLHEFDHRVVLRDEGVSRLLPQPLEDACDGRVFEVLRHHGEGEAAKAPDLADQFKVAESAASPTPRRFDAPFRLRSRIGDVDDEMFLPRLLGQLCRPEEIDERCAQRPGRILARCV